MNTYLTTDTHFGHDKIMEYCGRPKNHEKLITNELKRLKSNHMLIHLGDICWGNDKKWHESVIQPLPCKKILVRGNHDSKSNNWYMNHGWDFVCNQFQLKRGKNIIVFSHEPRAWDGYFDLNIHGHLHNAQHHLKNEMLGIQRHGQYLICIEDLKYKLVSLDKLLGGIFKTQPE